jgi:hypothetical protein
MPLPALLLPLVVALAGQPPVGGPAARGPAARGPAAREVPPDRPPRAATAVGSLGAGTVYDGRRGSLDVALPRLEGAAAAHRLDGLLDEEAWGQAARLVGFSQFFPADGITAVDSTEVLVWYSPTALHVGVRAFAPPGTVNATLADRDRIGGDDQVQLLLGTFDDQRQAIVLAVNPLGIQADGTLVETGTVSQGGFGNATSQGTARENADLSADFVWQSKGHVTPWGYEVELRVPFKSLKYQATDVQRWGFHVVRRVARLGAEDTWAPARRGAASFLRQGGRLVGLRDLQRGLVLDLTPTLTQRTVGAALGPSAGAPAGAAGPWDYRVNTPEAGGTLRWGVTNNLTLNATVRPDFSQVEADAAQVQFDPRQSLFFPERRPFFLDGIEQFATPGNLIYTRRIVQPTTAVKLSGKLAGTDVAVLSALDDPNLPVPAAAAWPERHPVYNIVRVQRDVAAASRVGLIATTRDAGPATNRVLGVDGRATFRGVYTATGQLVASATRDARGAPTRTGPQFQAGLVRNGRRFGARYNVFGISPEFEPGAGLVARANIFQTSATHRVTFFNARTALVQSWGGNVVLDGLWKYDDFRRGAPMLERKLHVSTNAQLRGGWSGGASVLVEEFRYDPDLYANYWVERPAAGVPGGAPGARDTVRFVGTPGIPNLDWVLTLNTPNFRRFSGSAFVIWGRDENFFEWASGDIFFATLNATVRPTERLRLELQYQQQRFARPSDGSVVSVRHIPRAKLEYQVARPVFVRFVGQYVASAQDSLRDDSRTNAPILLRRPDGTFARTVARRTGTFRGDALFSWQPNPGTVFFAGYGSTLADAFDSRLSALRRTQDGFFVKYSYLWRVGA